MRNKKRTETNVFSLSFLDIICEQVKILNNKYNIEIPLVLMNSLNTENDTKNICKKYD